MGWNQSRVSTKPEITTHEGGRAFERSSPMEELYLLAAGSLMIQDTFYESKDERLERFRSLVSQCMGRKSGLTFLAPLAVYLREQLHLRSLPTMLVAECLQGGAPQADLAAQRVWVRGDEHLEALAYLAATKQKRTKHFLRAVAKRLASLSEKQLIKYAAGAKSFSQKDAICLSHPKPGGSPATAARLKYIRKGWDALTDEEKAFLPLVQRTKAGEALTWEQKLSAEGQKDHEDQSKARAWAEILPEMGYMALLRNLRNIHQATEFKAGSDMEKLLVGRLVDPDEVRRSKQLPFRFLNAARALTETRIPPAVINSLGRAMDISVCNVPEIPGHTALLVDLSGSMEHRLSPDSRASNGATYMDMACLLAAAWLRKNPETTVICFSSEVERVVIPAGTPVGAGAHILRQWRHAGRMTNMAEAVRVGLNHNPDRIMAITDEQSHDNVWDVLARWLDAESERNAYVVNLAGYKPGVTARHGRVRTAGGWNDSVFRWVEACELKNPVETIAGYLEKKEAPAQIPQEDEGDSVV